MQDDIIYLYGEITKKDKKQRTVEGIVNSGQPDLDGQIVDLPWLKSKLPPWLTEWGNVREMHQPSAVGVGKELDLDATPGPKLTSKIIDDNAWAKVEAGVYKGYSVGIKSAVIVRDSQAPRGRIVGGELVEISLVDRPCDSLAKFTLVKAAGANEWKDEQTGAIIALDGRGEQAVMADVEKREFSSKEREDLADSGAALPDGSFPIANEQDLKNAIQAIGRAKDPAKAKSHIIRRAKALGKTNLLPEDWPGSTKGKEKGAMPDEEKAGEVVAKPVEGEGNKAADGSEATISHPATGVHNHSHIHKMYGEATEHTHGHQHDEDDVHDHMHCMKCAKDARVCKCEGAKVLSGPAEPTTSEGATKAAGDVNATNASTAPRRPITIGDVQTTIKDALQRLEALANQTDPDRDGDVEFPNENEAKESKTESADFKATEAPNGTPTITPSPLALTFSSMPDLVKALLEDKAFVSGLMSNDVFMSAVRSEIQKGTTDQFLTKAAAADTLSTMADVSTLLGDVAKASTLLAKRAEANAEEMKTLRADVEKQAAEIDQVKEMAAPPKGNMVAVNKGMLLESDTFVDAMKGGTPDQLVNLAEQLSKMPEHERMAFAAKFLKASTRQS